jgi:hypothetical protein
VRPQQHRRNMLKKKGLNGLLSAFFVFFIVITITGCAQPQPVAPTLTPPLVDTPVPTLPPTLVPPTKTTAPTPTGTTQPSPTPIPLPAGISDVVTNASIKYQDTFAYTSLLPKGWSYCAGFDAIYSVGDGHLLVNAPTDKYGTLFYYDEEMINPNEAVYFLFAYEGNQGDFSLGFDGYVNGKVCDSTKSKVGWYSVALQHMPGLPLTVHSLTSTTLPTGYFKGDWRLQELKWYAALMGFDQSNTFFIDIWDPASPNQKLVFKQTYPDFPKTYNFISWLDVRRKMMIDDFSIISFDSIR